MFCLMGGYLSENYTCNKCHTFKLKVREAYFREVKVFVIHFICSQYISHSLFFFILLLSLFTLIGCTM